MPVALSDGSIIARLESGTSGRLRRRRVLRATCLARNRCDQVRAATAGCSGRFTPKHRCLVGEKTIPGPPLRYVGGSLNNQECARGSLERKRSPPSSVSGATAISYGCAMLYGNRRCDRRSGMPSALCPDAEAAGAGQLSGSAGTEESEIRRCNGDSSISGKHASFAWGVPCIDASTTGDFLWKGTNTPARRLEPRAKS